MYLKKKKKKCLPTRHPQSVSKAAAAYVNDAILIATANIFPEAHDILENVMTRPGGAIDWSKNHNSRFEFSTLTLINFAHSVKTRRP